MLKQRHIIIKKSLRFFILGLLLFINSCSTTSVESVKGNNLYSKFIGKKYKLNYNGYIFEFTDNYSVKYFSANTGIIGASNNRFPKMIDYKLVGKKIDNNLYKIYSVIPKGSVFQIVDVIVEDHVTMGREVYYILLFKNGITARGRSIYKEYSYGSPRYTEIHPKIATPLN